MSLLEAHEYTLDDSSILRAIIYLDGENQLHEESIILKEIVNSQAFEVIRTNDHLRSLLRAFLEANIAVEVQKRLLSKTRSLGFMRRLAFRKDMKIREGKIIALSETRDEAFKSYEMLRKLTDTGNMLLKRYKS